MPANQKSLAIPTVHLNGTSQAGLLQQLMDAVSALRAAREAMQKAGPNGRDYYVQGDSSLRTAIQQHTDRLFKIDEVIADYETIMEGIADQADPRSHS